MARHRTISPHPEHASLRTIAGLVAVGAPASEVFATVAREVARVSGCELVLILRFEPGDAVSIAGAWGTRPHRFEPEIGRASCRERV